MTGSIRVRRQPIVALSTGWLFEHGRHTYEDQEPFFHVTDGVELSITNPRRFAMYSDPFPELSYKSFHISALPTYESLERLTNTHSPETVVVHPTKLDEMDVHSLKDSGIPLAVENMDSSTTNGHDIDEISEYMDEYDIDFVLDVQHAYEHDATMEYAWRLVEMAGDNLAEVHVSGQTDTQHHALLQHADNQEEILEFLTQLFKSDIMPPLIIEGNYSTVDEVIRENALLKNTLIPHMNGSI